MTQVSPRGRLPGNHTRNLPRPAGSGGPVWASKVRKGLWGSRAPCSRPQQGGLGVYFKTSASWGGRSSPLGPNASNASMGEPP